jgi:alpha-1,2-mannosyltransferase
MFWLLAASRVLGALLAPIPDCDEVFNYWEPVHFLVHGRGQETWEYSPEYALRSYWFIVLHALPTYLLSLVVSDRIYQFRIMRAVLGLLGAKCQHFCWSRLKRMYSVEEKKTAKAVLVLNQGLFLASHTFLPSTFSMNMLLLALGFFLDYTKSKDMSRLALCLLGCAYGVGVGWPFCIVLIFLFLLPFAHKVIVELVSVKVLSLALAAVAAALLPSFLADYYYYGKPVLGVLNLVLYNTSFGRGNLAGSSLLYGVEPWYFYLANLLLNFNLVFVGFLVYPCFFLWGLVRKTEKHRWIKLGLVSGSFGWLLLMSLQPHKVPIHTGRALHVPHLSHHLSLGSRHHHSYSLTGSNLLPSYINRDDFTITFDLRAARA